MIWQKVCRFVAITAIAVVSVSLVNKDVNAASFTYVGRILTNDEEMAPVTNANIKVTFKGRTLGKDSFGPLSTSTDGQGYFIVYESEDAPSNSFLFHQARIEVGKTDSTKSGNFNDSMTSSLDIGHVASSLGLTPDGTDIIKALIEGATEISFLPDLSSTGFVGAVGAGVHKVEPIPEPLTIFGASAALGFGTFFKLELKKQKRKQTKA